MKTLIGIAALAAALHMRNKGDETLVTPILGTIGVVILVKQII